MEKKKNKSVPLNITLEMKYFPVDTNRSPVNAKSAKNTILSGEKTYSMWSVDNYAKDHMFIDKKIETYSLDEKIEILENNDKCYHDRIDKNMSYKFFGDCDNYNGPFEDFKKILIEFLKEKYDTCVEADEVSHTENIAKKGSYHYVIPKLHASVNKQKEMHQNLLNEYKNDFSYIDENKKRKNCVDTSVYSDHWFRCPNQTADNGKKTKHIIVNGSMKDFVLDYIEHDSTNIDNNIYHDVKIIEVNNKNVKMKKPVIQSKKIMISERKIQKKITPCSHEPDINVIKEQIVKNVEQDILYKFFDECFSEERFNVYEYWIKVGMAIKNRYGDNGYDIFKYFSNKSSKPDSDQQIRNKYASFKIDNNNNNQITLGTIYHYAKEDNKDKYIELIKNFSVFKEFDMSSVMISKYIKMLKPNDFIWKNGILYCFNGKFWERDDLLLRKYIGNELFDFLKDILVTCFWNTKEFVYMKKLLEKLRSLVFKKEIIETTKEDLTNNDVEFDNKWNLLGFNNVVLDLETFGFRDYRYSDYISTTTGYDWIEPKKIEIEKMKKLIESIHPNESERQLYLEILSTGLEGRCLEKFTLHNGKGGNGKGLINDIALKAFGNYGMIGNNAILFEKNKTGSNPEKSNLHMKRFVIFREPAEKSKIENSVTKELTGGGDFSARGHYETNTKKKLVCTIILECNKRPLFAEEPQEAELRRLIDIYFPNKFTDKKENVDEANNVFLANIEYKTEDFQEKHKRALIKILLDFYKKYKERNYLFDVPKSIENRTKLYLQMSSNILTWINDEYEQTTDKNDFIKLHDMFNEFKHSDHYENLTKSLKLKYNKTYFVNEISENIFLNKFYRGRAKICGKDYSNILTNYKKTQTDEIF